ncbi:MAG TPA: hypothetical protein VKX16_07825 [Chloroflexota bacterium]|nr:hypothetical protein [Chloroflexota bacterium]
MRESATTGARPLGHPLGADVSEKPFEQFSLLVPVSRDLHFFQLGLQTQMHVQPFTQILESRQPSVHPLFLPRQQVPESDHSQELEQPAARSVIRSLVPILVINGVLPIILYQVLTGHGVAEVPALVAGSVLLVASRLLFYGLFAATFMPTMTDGRRAQRTAVALQNAGRS